MAENRIRSIALSQGTRALGAAPFQRISVVGAQQCVYWLCSKNSVSLPTLGGKEGWQLRDTRQEISDTAVPLWHTGCPMKIVSIYDIKKSMQKLTLRSLNAPLGLFLSSHRPISVT